MCSRCQIEIEYVELNSSNSFSFLKQLDSSRNKSIKIFDSEPFTIMLKTKKIITSLYFIMLAKTVNKISTDIVSAESKDLKNLTAVYEDLLF